MINGIKSWHPSRYVFNQKNRSIYDKTKKPKAIRDILIQQRA